MEGKEGNDGWKERIDGRKEGEAGKVGREGRKEPCENALKQTVEPPFVQPVP